MVLSKVVATGESDKPRLVCMEKGPGPAKYCLPGTTGMKSHDPTKKIKPAYTFGIKHKLYNEFHKSPGPVYFVPPTLTRKGLDGIPSYSMTGRRRSPILSNSPGPNSYRTEDAPPMKLSRPPCYTFGSRTRYMKVPNNPAPNSYTLPSMIGSKVMGKTSAAAYSMTGRSIIGSCHQDFRKTPGPGAYSTVDPSVTKVKVPVYTLKGRAYPPLSKGDVPGPGTYRPERVYVNKRIAPSYSFGIKHSEYLASFDTTN